MRVCSFQFVLLFLSQFLFLFCLATPHIRLPIDEIIVPLKDNDFLQSSLRGKKNVLSKVKSLARENSAGRIADSVQKKTMSSLGDTIGKKAVPIIENLGEKRRALSRYVAQLIEMVVDSFRKVFTRVQDSRDLFRLMFPKKPLPSQRDKAFVEIMWEKRPMFLQFGNELTQRKIVSDRVVKKYEKHLSWLPSSVQEKTKKWIVKNAPWFFDILCKGQTHSNPRIQQLFRNIMSEITKENPTINGGVIGIICSAKKAPF